MTNHGCRRRPPAPLSFHCRQTERLPTAGRLLCWLTAPGPSPAALGVQPSRMRSTPAPEKRHVVLLDFAVRSQQCEVLHQRLRDQHPVKWIAVVRWKSEYDERMLMRDGERPESLSDHPGRHIRSGRLRKLELPARRLDRHLPGCDGRQKYLLGGVGKNIARRL